jgi:hypothetical protein
MIKAHTDVPGSLRTALESSGWVGEPILAAGAIRQGKKPSMLSMVVGYGLWEVMRPRRSKLLPRHFVLGLTPTRVVAFKALGVSDEDGENYRVHIREGDGNSYAREQVSITGLVADGDDREAIMRIGDAAFPIRTDEDPNTDELIALLAR